MRRFGVSGARVRLLLACVLMLPVMCGAQERADSTRRDSVARPLPGVVVTARRTPGAVSGAPRIVAGMITTGAKSEVVAVSGSTTNIAEKVGRQLFAEVPGVFVYDMDGSGNQVNISARGLDAHRSWEFSVRQNGVVTNSDVYGYPASHYSAPMEAIERVELVRGTAALQYGSQFGGVINYVVRTPDTTRAIAFDSRSSAGGFGLLSTYNAIGGKAGRVTYYAYGSVRRSDGYRANGRSVSDAEYVSASAPLSNALTLRADVARSRYLYRQPGPLTDAMFAVDARSATRSRNYYSPDIIVPSLSLTWTPGAATRATLLASGVFGSRSSVAVGGFATQPDTASASGVYSARQVDIDKYDSRTLELRVLHEVSIAEKPATLSLGVAVSDNDTWRRQRGTGSRGSDYDLTLQPNTTFQRNLHYLTENVAAYAELELRLSPRFCLVPGVRVERGTTRMRGTLAYYDPADTPRDVRHNFPLFGMRGAYKFSGGGEWYGGFSQAYRPMILKDLLPETATERTDTNIRDARGWTMESGVRRTFSGGVSYDVSAFAMRYENRFGLLTLSDPDGTPYTFKTNVGTTRTMGVESRLAIPLGYTGHTSWRAFTAASLMNAKYVGGSFIASGRNVSIAGNEVESAPRWIVRSGVSASGRRADATVQVSHVSRTFADALNTVQASANGATGIVPAYTLVDVHGGVALTRLSRVTAGVSNVFDRQYFTKRPQFYPGPGVWPSDGRSIYLSLALQR
ncbi:MAG: TonB-dependent receptor [Gemmatimonadaceae bacterium]|nr:TonB-dependent receptor [Gemmatimonadaceae bacterium]